MNFIMSESVWKSGTTPACVNIGKRTFYFFRMLKEASGLKWLGPVRL